ncbi:MAG: threonine--tRNA ligase [Baileyella intestinalis]|uniref:Threonine--tRNA ligase n=1 Tax=Baileyella intestinalis TaxID=2606709 RepID=A0A6A8M6E7_9FIRM|nr:threonine--tRNA ligase [Baileyella intestinalis]MDY2995354.1 threonine--tRNA ligase [Baileyella intestinalis]MST68270.1 threonine--tRNA ligase [Baileyella intestinalis]
MAKIDFSIQEERDRYRHSTSHIMAQAVKRLWPEAKLAIGPAIENGFYYDFDLEHKFTDEDLQAITKEMKKIIKAAYPIERFELPREEAIKFMEERNEPYKVELIKDLPEGEVISFYKQGDFTDLCAGPHMESTGQIKAYKLQNVAGAYWRGDSNNKMLQRIYGTSFPSQEELKEYLDKIEEAKKRDHRKIGKEMELFMVSEAGPGFPFFLPNGMIIRNELQKYWKEIHWKAGYKEILTPLILNEELWRISGHWDHYKDNMYFTQIDDEDYAIKPMNCPGSILVYKNKSHSYRELPLRYAEMGQVHRHELSGALHGLMRVRTFFQDDAHIYMTREQVGEELLNVIRLIDSFYKVFNFKYHVELSTRPDDFMGEISEWDAAEQDLRTAIESIGKEYVVNEGDGAFYGPKLDFHLEDSLGRTWQCGTIQLDFQMPQRFGMSYIGSDGEKHTPIMIHRAIMGSVERFIGMLTEHFAGKFPLWLAPVQVKLMTVTDANVDYAEQVREKCEAAGLRVETDYRNEKIGYKIREARNARNSYMCVIGEKEAEEKSLSVRSSKAGDLGSMSVDDFVAKLVEEVETKAL